MFLHSLCRTAPFLCILSTWLLSALAEVVIHRCGDCDFLREESGALAVAGVCSCRYVDIYNKKVRSVPPGVLQEVRDVLQIRLIANELVSVQRGTFTGLSQVTLLDLAENKLTHLEKEAFTGLASLHTLDLRFNLIGSLQPGVFEPLQSLETLLLSGNRIDNLAQGVFNGLDLLRTLRISNNRLRIIPNEAFGGLPMLTLLELDQNRISNISDTAFVGLSSLETLRMDFNNLTVLDGSPFVDLDAVIQLNLEHNQLRSFAESSWRGLSSLTSLWLGFNELSVLPARGFAALRSLRTLRMQKNKLRHVGASSFEGLSSLQDLHLSQNALTGWDHGALAPLQSVRALSLDSNALAALPPLAFQGMTAMTRLELTRNSIASVSVEAFHGLTSLSNLNLDHNNISHWPPKSLDGLSALAELTVRDNSIESVPTDAFLGASALTSLDLSGNAIRAIEAGAFSGLRSMRWLSLYNNSLRELRDDMWGTDMVQLRSLEAGENSVRSLIGAAFQSLSSLVGLYLSNNQLAALSNETLAGLSSLQSLRMDGNKLTHIDADAFRDLALVYDLQMSRNRLQSLAADAFRGLTSLSNLALGQNELTTLPTHAFRGLSLMYLDLFSNRISSIEAGAFEGVTAIDQLSLSNNRLSTLAAGSLEGLSSLSFLSVARNNLSRIEHGAFSDLAALTRLDLQDNQLAQLQPSLFASLTSLRHLQLARNQLTHVQSGWFLGLSGVQQLDVTENRIVTLSPAAFLGLSNLGSLELGRNRISHVSGDVWEGLDSLHQLSLGSNAIRRLSRDAFASLSKVWYLSLDSAGLEEIEAGAFDGMERLRDVYITGNPLRALPTGFLRGSRALYSLNLQDNAIATLGGALRGLGMRQLYLKGNKLRELHDEFEGCVSLDYLELRGNLLQSISAGAFRDLRSLYHLDLSENWISSVSPTAMQGLHSLRGLYLSRNNLTSLGARWFRNMSSLQDLQVDRNRIQTVDEAALDGLASLRELDLAHNKIATLPRGVFDRVGATLETLDLGHNALAALAPGLWSLVALRSLLLRSNQIARIEHGFAGALARLDWLELDGNPLACFPLALAFLDTDLHARGLPPCPHECWDTDSTAASAIPVSLDPPYSGVLGGAVVAVRGPCFVPSVAVSCIFGSEQVQAKVLSSMVAVCVAPMMPSASAARVPVSIRVGSVLLPAARRFEYVSERQLPGTHRITAQVEDDGVSIHFRWSPSTPHLAGFVDAAPQVVSLELWTLTPSAFGATRLRSLADGVANSGHAVLRWPDDVELADMVRKVPFVRLWGGTADQPSAFEYRSLLAMVDLAHALRRFTAATPSDTLRRHCRMAQEARERVADLAWLQRLPACPPALSNVKLQPLDPSSSPLPDGLRARPWFGWSAHPLPRTRADRAEAAAAAECVASSGRELHSRQVCCYDNRGALVGSLGEGALLAERARSDMVAGAQLLPGSGIAESDSAVHGFVAHWMLDVAPQYLCCVAAGPHSQECSRLDDGRRSSTSPWTPPRIASVFGDPHLVTLDGVELTLNGVGEYYGILSTDLLLQLSMQKPRNVQHPRGTVVAAVAVQATADATPLSFYLQQGAEQDSVGITALSGQERLEIENREDVVVGDGGQRVHLRVGKGWVECVTLTGATVTLWAEGPSLSLRVLVALDRLGERAFGLLGKVQTDDGPDGFMLRNGSVLDAASSQEALQQVFLEDWRVTEGASKILNGNGDGGSDDEHAPHLPLPPLTVPAVGAAGAEGLDALCGDVLPCRFDALALNSTEAGAAALANSRLNRELAGTSNLPPRFVLPSSARHDVRLDDAAVPSSRTTLVFSAVDPDNNTAPQIQLRSAPACCADQHMEVHRNGAMDDLLLARLQLATTPLEPHGVTAVFSCQVGGCPRDLWVVGWVRMLAVDASGVGAALSVELFNSASGAETPVLVHTSPIGAAADLQDDENADPRPTPAPLQSSSVASAATFQPIPETTETQAIPEISTTEAMLDSPPPSEIEVADSSNVGATSSPQVVLVLVLLACALLVGVAGFCVTRHSGAIRGYFVFRDYDEKAAAEPD